MRADVVFALFDLDCGAFLQRDAEVDQKCHRRYTLNYMFDPLFTPSLGIVLNNTAKVFVMRARV